MRGPIDFIVIEFDGNKFKGEILKELETAVNNKIIDVLDIALITKDSAGNTSAIELSNLDSDLAKQISTADGGLITDEDVAEVSELLNNDCSAGLLVIEQLWAKGLKKAVINANGRLLSEGRIHPDAAEEINQKEGE